MCPLLNWPHKCIVFEITNVHLTLGNKRMHLHGSILKINVNMPNYNLNYSAELATVVNKSCIKSMYFYVCIYIGSMLMVTLKYILASYLDQDCTLCAIHCTYH